MTDKKPQCDGMGLIWMQAPDDIPARSPYLCSGCDACGHELEFLCYTYAGDEELTRCKHCFQLTSKPTGPCKARIEKNRENLLDHNWGQNVIGGSVHNECRECGEVRPVGKKLPPGPCKEQIKANREKELCPGTRGATQPCYAHTLAEPHYRDGQLATTTPPESEAEPLSAEGLASVSDTPDKIRKWLPQRATVMPPTDIPVLVEMLLTTIEARDAEIVDKNNGLEMLTLARLEAVERAEAVEAELEEWRSFGTDDGKADPGDLLAYTQKLQSQLAQAQATIVALREAISALHNRRDIPEYHEQGMGCGVEDRAIVDVYEAARYGWEQAEERLLNWMDDYIVYELITDNPAEGKVLVDAGEVVNMISALKSYANIQNWKVVGDDWIWEGNADGRNTAMVSLPKSELEALAATQEQSGEEE